MKDLLKFAALILVFTIVCSSAGYMMESTMTWPDYIHTEEGNPNVVYVEGDNCTLNMTDDIAIDQLNHNMIWCMEQHLNYLAEEKK